MTVFDYLRHPIDINRPLEPQLLELPVDIYNKWISSITYYGISPYTRKTEIYDRLVCNGAMYTVLDKLRKIIKEHNDLD